MAVEVCVPDLGKDVEEATIIRWRVKEGASVQEGDVLLELATGKVDTEMPSPASGTVLKIVRGDGEVVRVGEVIALIGEPGEEITPAETPTPTAEPARAAAAPAAAAPAKATPVARRMAEAAGVDLSAIRGTGPGGQVTKADVERYLQKRETQEPAAAAPQGVAPLPDEFADVPSLSVRRLAAEFNVNLREVANGRPLSTLTQFDVLKFVAEKKGIAHLPTEPRYPTAPVTPRPQAAPPPAPPSPALHQPLSEDEIFVPHTRMRKLIAENTARSAFTAPHVTTVWDVDMSAVLAHRRKYKPVFAQRGVNLTLTAYFVKALVTGVRAVPAANATWTDEGIIIKRRVHVGLAVAIPPDEHGLGGLIVPVIKHADELTLEAIARRVNDLVQRARENRLRPEDLEGGTITLTNYGVTGSRFQTPIIVQPQVAILGVGAVEKRPVVVSRDGSLEPGPGDALGFRPMVTLALSYDHRVLNGATADAFCKAVKDALENWPLNVEG